MKRNLKFKIENTLMALTKDSSSVNISYTMTIKASTSLFKWFIRYDADTRKRMKVDMKRQASDLIPGNLRIGLGKTNLEDIDNFKFSIPDMFTKAFRQNLNDDFKFSFVKLNKINIELPEGVAESLAEKRQDRNAFLDELLS